MADNNAVASMFSFEISLWVGTFVFWPICDSMFAEVPVLPDMKQIGMGTKHAAAMDTNKPTVSTEIVLDFLQPKSLILFRKSSNTRAVLKHGYIL